MRRTYVARLANLQAQINSNPEKAVGVIIRQFLAHEASTTRNLKRTILLTPELAHIISGSPHAYLTGTTPFLLHFSLSTIYSQDDHTYSINIYSFKFNKIIYSQVIPLLSFSL